MKLEKICKYNAILRVDTGLSIKGNNNDINIGGLDSEVIKNPITGDVYLPGSSIKGKIRSLLELEKGIRIEKDKKGEDFANPCGGGKCDICRIFGAHKNPKAETAPTRIIVRDASMTDASKNIILNMPLESGSYLEAKVENSINRAKGTADAPRYMERIPAGLEFNLEILLQIFDNDDEKAMKEKIERGLILLQNSYLGNSGSRGYGKVTIKDGEWTEV